MREIQGKFNKESFRINSDLKNVPEVKTNAVGRLILANRRTEKYFEEKKKTRYRQRRV